MKTIKTLIMVLVLIAIASQAFAYECHPDRNGYMRCVKTLLGE